jgi:hypothetical protein
MKMKTEYQKMLAGELYDSGDDTLVQMRVAVRSLLREYNQTAYDKTKRAMMLEQILGKMGSITDIRHLSFAIMAAI